MKVVRKVNTEDTLVDSTIGEYGQDGRGTRYARWQRPVLASSMWSLCGRESRWMEQQVIVSNKHKTH